MKHLFTICWLAGSVGAAAAQTPITITAAQFPAATVLTDRLQPAATTGVSAPQYGANQTWDYRSLVPQGAAQTITYAAVPSASAPFAGSVRSNVFSSALGPFSVTATAYEGFDAAGFAQLGAVVPAQTFPLATVTGGANDVLTVPAQTTAINTLRLPLPLTSTTRVMRTNRVLNNSLLTVQIIGLSQAPLRYVQRITTVDSVAGWGTVRIPVAGNAAGSAAIPVLLVQRRVIQQDSFYLNNQPAPAALLGLLGQSQGVVSRTYARNFFRQNAAQPVLVMAYATNTFTAPTSVIYSVEATIPLKAAAARELTAGGLTAWPNPVSQGRALQFSLATVAPAQPLRLTLRDALGRVVANYVASNGQSTSLPLLPAGLYLAEAEAANGANASRRIVIE